MGGKHPSLQGLYLTEMEQSIRIEAFVRGWLACLNQKPLDPDKPLTVSRVPKPNHTFGNEVPNGNKLSEV